MNAAAFPVIATDESGTVIAKNRAAYTYLKSIRIKSSLSEKASFFDNGALTLSRGDMPFRRAVGVPVGVGGKTVTIFLFLPSAQSGNGFETFDAARVFDIIKSGREAGDARRLYSEMAEAFAAFDRDGTDGGETTDVPRTAEILNKRFSSGFRALGCRAAVSCTDGVICQRFFKLNFHAFVYSVLTAAYVAMRLSQSGAADVVIDYDEDARRLYVTSSSRTSAKMPRGAKCAEDAVSALVPEFAVEMTADRELSPERAAKKCTIKDGVFTFSIPVKVDVRATALRSRGSLYSLDEIAGRIFDGFAASARKIIGQKTR